MAKKTHRSRNAATPLTPAAAPRTPQKAQYDIVGPGASKKRRPARVEYHGETGRDSRQLPPMARLMAISLVRDACRNFSSARAIIQQIALNVVGTEYKVIIKDPSVKGRENDPTHPVVAAQNWFNDTWAKNPDFRNDNHLFDVNRLLLTSVVRDGDAGMLFDRDFTQSGKIVTFESDQICDPSPLPDGAAESNDGILLDHFGREIGYCTHFSRGKTQVKLDEAHIFPRDPVDPDANMFKLLRMPWRANQGRGTSDMFSFVADMLDIYEMRSKELQSAKVAATMAGMVTKNESDTGPALDDARYDPLAPIAEFDDEEHPAVKESDNYNNFETLTGGLMEYMIPGEKFDLLTSNRPNVNGIPFTEHIIKSAGSAVGMARCYSTMEAQTSYTAFRGEMVMTWVMFRYWQKWLERYVQDWQAVRAINFAISIKAIDPLPAGWSKYLAWQHPKMPSLNPLVDQNTFLAALKNGSTNLEQELGPNWKNTVQELITEVEFMREANLPHAMFETKAGAVAGVSTKE